MATSLNISPTYLEMELECAECGRLFISTPDMVLGHLIETHHYTVDQAEQYIKNWIEGFPQDENGEPLGECKRHGYYRLGDLCYGCERDEWKKD